MTIKEQAYRAHALMQASGCRSLKRSHVHELLAASLGYASHASFQHNATWCNTPFATTGIEPSEEGVRARYRELGLPDGEITLASDALIRFQLEQGYAPVGFEALIRAADDVEDDPSWNQWISTEIVEPGRRDVVFYLERQPMLLHGLELAASRGIAAAHYAIAVLLENEAETYPAEEQRTKRHYRREGVWTSPFVSFAELGIDPLRAEDKYRHHLFEAARGGDLRALLASAARFSDPAILGHSPSEFIDPAVMIQLAAEHENTSKLHLWLTAAAREGDVDAMRELILSGAESLEQAWVWMHLSRLMGQDLSQDRYELVQENGAPYDDDIGGPGYPVGDNGIELKPLPSSIDARTREEAAGLLARIHTRDGVAR